MERARAFRRYYTEHFPVREVFEVFRIDERREVSMANQQNTFMRYLSFSTAEEFASKVAQVAPLRVDLGPIYPHRPSKGIPPYSIARELTFDIDLTDYPRACCQGKCICPKCYEKVRCAARLLDYSLRNELGFEQLGFVYSGRRGLHCWVFDILDLPKLVRADIYGFYRSVVAQNLDVPEYREIMAGFAGEDKEMIKNWFLYIDRDVLAIPGHLTKCPFSVHPDTFNISVPVDPHSLPELSEYPKVEDVLLNPRILDTPIAIMKNWRPPVARQAE